MLRVLPIALMLCACSHQSVLVKRPADTSTDQAVTAMWTTEIASTARDGDWLLTRSYALVADGIVTVTPGESLSHASIYDAERGTVIEAISDGVREVPLSQLVGRNHYVIVVRPSNMTAAEQHDAVVRARSKLGSKYDVSGLVGVDHKDQYYCSELVYWASQTEARSGRKEHVVTPSDLMQYGEVIYWSGKRDDDQVMALAKARADERHAGN
jgi:uncharacterized protein YycO